VPKASFEPSSFALKNRGYIVRCTIYVALHNKIGYKTASPGSPLPLNLPGHSEVTPMNNFDPQVAAEMAREAYRETIAQFEPAALEAAIPESVRTMAEKTVAQTRDVYERSKLALEAGLDAVEKALDAAGQGATALNRKVIDIAERNVNSGFDLAKSLAGAKTVPQAVELQSEYWRKQLESLPAQAEELRVLSTKVAADTLDPIKTQIARGMN
jgi:phasin